MKNTMKKPVNIPVSKLRPFEGHPFKVKDVFGKMKVSQKVSKKLAPQMA